MRIKSPSPKSTNKKPLWAVLFALWLVFILLSQVPLLANTLIDYSDMDETVESHLRFPVDGRTGHYYVERHDTAKVGLIDVEYTTDSNSLEVDCTNIKVLKIYCRDMYDDKSEDVFKRDPELDSNYYKTYFYERDHFHVHVYSQQMIEKLEWIDTPVPYNVTVNGREWWLTNINYTHNNDGIVLTKVPAGHNYVDLYFKTNDQNAPVAKFTTDKTIQCLGEPIKFDASSSYDTDGEIIRYVWDLGEGTYKIGETTEHTFSEEGTYNVILTVKDDDYLIDRAIKEITVISSVMSLVKSVDKPIATPGSVLTYTITPTINATWEECVKDIVVTDILSDDLEFVDSTPKPMLDNKTLTWKFNKAICNKDLPTILLQTLIDKKSDNSTFITNSANLEYKSLNDGLFPQELSNTVRTKVNTGSILAPRILSPVPDIEMEEDSTPFELFLSMYEYDLQDSGSELKWYITEEDEFLYGLTGENSDDDIITITPRPNAYGDSKVTLWLVDSDGYTVNQPLWINITPVNDKPLFSKIPDLTVHHSQPYIFNYEPYISDIDTPKEQLRLFVSEKSQSDSGTVSTRADTQSSNIQINGFNVTYTFPKSYLDKEVFVALIVFDGYGNDGENTGYMARRR